MKLEEIIRIHKEQPTTSIEVSLLKPYKEQLGVYFKNYYNTDELILMVTTVFNAAQYARIVPVDDFEESIRDYFGEDEFHEEDLQNEIELISAQSILYRDF